MNPALRTLEEWTTHQDYLWFLALLAWAGVMIGEWRHKGQRPGDAPRYWLVTLAASGIATAALELVLLAQDIAFPYTRLDAAMGAAQALGAASLGWGACQGRKRAEAWRAVILLLVAGGATLRVWRPVEGGVVICLVQGVATLGLIRRTRESIPALAGPWLVIAPAVATYGPLAYAIDHGRKTTDWSHFSLVAAGTLMGAGVVLASELWQRRLRQVMPENAAAAAALRRDLRRALMVLACWLLGGVLLAVWYGRLARRAFEENLLRRMETAVLALDGDMLSAAFGPALRVEGVESKKYPDGTPVEVARTPRTSDPVYGKLRTQMARIREQNPDFRLFYIVALRQGLLLEFASERRRTPEPDTRVVTRRAKPDDLLHLADRRSFLEGPQRRRWGPVFSAQAPIFHPTTGQILGWLVADINATRWLVTFTQARLQTMALVGAGVGLWALAVAYRLRRESRDAAEQKAAAAAAADRMKSVFLAKVSHELRTPIQSVLGYGELLAAAPLSDLHRTWLTSLRSHGDIMLRLVNDLIELGALQSGAFQLELAPVRLPALVDECAASLRPAAAERGLELQINLAPDVPESVTADGVRLRQVLLNLLNNAVKFTPKGHVRLDVNRDESGRIEFVVSDTGPGFPPALRQRLFQPFTRLDPASAGSGLGLALVHGLCAAMGGSVRLSDDVEHGATFVVSLPLPSHESSAPSTFPVAATGGTLRGLDVVVAEDNTLVRELLVTFLADNGAEVFAAMDGPAAVALTREKRPDVLLLDIALPSMDGIAVAQALRDSGMTDLRIIGLSAHAGPGDEARARAAGMDDFFTKPVSLARLGAALVRQPRPEPARVALGASVSDERLRARLVGEFARETPRVLEEIRLALDARDWPRLRNRAHYLKNSADILGASDLQQACRRLEAIDDTTQVAVVRGFVDAVANAIPEKALALAESSSADPR